MAGFKPGDVVQHKASKIRMVVVEVEDTSRRAWLFRPVSPAFRWVIMCKFYGEKRTSSGRLMGYTTEPFSPFELEKADGA